MMKTNICSLVLVPLILGATNFTRAEDGCRLWPKYALISDADLLKKCNEKIHAILIAGESATIQIAKGELQNGLDGLLGTAIPPVDRVIEDGTIVAGVFDGVFKCF